MNTADLLQTVHRLYVAAEREPTAEALTAVENLLSSLESGEVRAARRSETGEWQVVPEVKEGILLAFRVGRLAVFPEPDVPMTFSDKSTFRPRPLPLAFRNIRLVPGGSSVRRGAYLGRDVACMPPMFVNVGAWIGEGTMIDSHALVGSCAQIGRGVHLSAAAQIGGVLEPIGMRPVIIEDGVLVGGNCGVYEGTLVRERAVLGAGVVLTASTRVYDLVEQRILRATDDAPLEIPPGAVVVPGTRPIEGSDFAKEHGLQICAPVIVKYRDSRTDLRAALEGDLR
jgi:2,3,4,5-tetrahydropyridine-2-carboxylate N-succinyltransferase